MKKVMKVIKEVHNTKRERKADIPERDVEELMEMTQRDKALIADFK